MPQVQPSTERCTTWSAPGSGSASSSSALIGVPSHSALPIRSPPTSLDTQASVTYRSIIGRCSSSRPGDRDRVAHHPVDPQLPGRRVDLRRVERGVDPVEVPVGRHVAASRPATCTPAGSGGAACTGAGSDTPSRAAVTARREVSSRPADPADAAATPAATPSALRNRRRLVGETSYARPSRPRRPPVPRAPGRPPSAGPPAGSRHRVPAVRSTRSPPATAAAPTQAGSRPADRDGSARAARRRAGSPRRPRRPPRTARSRRAPAATSRSASDAHAVRVGREQDRRAGDQRRLVVHPEHSRHRSP